MTAASAMQATGTEHDRIVAAIRRIEMRTGAQIVAAVKGKSDHYPEIPWKAFALGSAAAALIAAASAFANPGWIGLSTLLWSLLSVLVGGAATAAVALAFGPFGRLFLDRDRRRVEVRQAAQSLFLEHELHATRGRIGVLMLVSLFEREVVILPDSGLRERLTTEAFDAAVTLMRPALRRGRTVEAFLAGLAELERAMIERGITREPGLGNELPDAILQSDDPR